MALIPAGGVASASYYPRTSLAGRVPAQVDYR
ncbi:uncharacterized protein METZ01_LOCUS148921 [marine metagenome]|uniref:Uncharacterized protein n=1 Tax=marine metagenome TaxID=408172 RepID=A0A382A4T2_9ZZZZ